MKDDRVKKGLVVAVILLFIGVAIAPSINFTVVKASNDNDFVEVITQACGINGFGDTTVKLTREQYQDLEQYLVDFRARLNQTTTREEAVPIFKDAIVELNKYGLLPKEMNIERAQRLVTGFNAVSKLTSILKKTIRSNYEPTDEIENRLCLMAGKTTNTQFEGPMTIFFDMFFILSLFFYGGPASGPFSALLFIISLYFFGISTLFSSYNPFAVFYRVNFGGWTRIPDYPPDRYFSSGWFFTLGVNGAKTWQGEMQGALPIEGTIFLWSSQFSPGAIGFTGLKINPFGRTAFYLGSALWVKMNCSTN
jgi:hypothetical protein